MTKVPITRAIVSVYDKTGLERLAAALHAAGVEIVSTGSTAAAIAACGVPVIPVEEVTGFPECLGGRVKTLHPGVHAGLLADLRDPGQTAQLAQLEIGSFQLLVSSLYPFEQTVAAGAPDEEVIEQIDIGGPAMVRAAAKNHANVAVVTSAQAYGEVEAALAAGGFTLGQRRRLAAHAYARTASYDAAVASWFAASYGADDIARESGWPDLVAAVWTRRDVLRYGENPHQRAALYLRQDQHRADGSLAPTVNGGQPRPADPGDIATAEHLHGKAMSYNNYVDADAAWRTAHEFTEPCVAIVKHSNPCGVALGADIAEAHRLAHACDPASAFGGVIAANRPVTENLARQIAEIFTEVIVAPDYEPAALEVLTAKKNQRLLRCPSPRGHASPAGDTQVVAGPGPGPWPAARLGARSGPAAEAEATARAAQAAVEWRQISGGVLMQVTDTVTEPGDRAPGWRLVAGPAADAETLADLEFAWRACRSVKSNAILLASGRASVGVGMGQVNRVDAARLAVTRAGERATGSVAASDAYFPFPDGLEVLTDAGVRAIVEPGGSIRDPLVIEAAERTGVTLYFTGVRHFWH